MIHARTPARRTEPAPARKQPLEAAGKVLSSLGNLGLGRSEALTAIGQALGREPDLDVERLLRQCLRLLVPKAS
ncbi:MAG TPA: hypothetical protein VJN18_19180 [Polyangiaceae bacterium]|nr:hypothetical protein [Polyangiaceae bacterium]